MSVLLPLPLPLSANFFVLLYAGGWGAGKGVVKEERVIWERGNDGTSWDQFRSNKINKMNKDNLNKKHVQNTHNLNKKHLQNGHNLNKKHVQNTHNLKSTLEENIYENNINHCQYYEEAEVQLSEIECFIIKFTKFTLDLT